MKKLTILLLTFLLLFSFAGCGGEEAPEATPTPEVTVMPTETPAPTPVPKWKDLTKEYEAWVDEYIQTYKDAVANPTNNDIYDKLEEMQKQASKWDNRLYSQEMAMVDNPDQQKYVDEVLRITKKLEDFAKSRNT